MKLLSIIIPLYNTERYIEKCIQSCIDQNIDHEFYEIIVVNDGSTDNSIKIVEKFKEYYTNIIVYHQENRGVSAARNQGITLAKGDYIVFLDADDTIGENVLLELYNNIIYSAFDLAVLNSHEVGENLKHIHTRYPFPQKMSVGVHKGVELYKYYQRGSVCGCVFNKGFILQNEIRFLENLRNTEDTLFMAECFVYAQSIMYFNIDFYKVHVRENSASNTWDYNRIMGLVLALDYLSNLLKKNYFSPKQIAILHYTTFQTISMLVFQFTRFMGIRNIKKLRGVIKENTTFSLKNNFVKLGQMKLFILNQSIYLYIFLFYLKNKLRYFFN